MFLELIKYYNYYSRSNIQNILEGFDKFINYQLKLDLYKTKYSRIQNTSKIDSSNYFLEEFKIINDVPNDLCIDVEKAEKEEFKNIENIVFFDDIIGSGKTISKFFMQNFDKLKEVNCYILCIEIMSDSKNYLEPFFEENNINCELHGYNIQDKAFNIDILGEDYLKKEKLVYELEKKIWGKESDFIMGFENSQAIVSFFRNTPNNTISSFWYDNSNWKGLFPRTQTRDWIEGKKQRNIKYNLSKLEGRNNG